MFSKKIFPIVSGIWCHIQDQGREFLWPKWIPSASLQRLFFVLEYSLAPYLFCGTFSFLTHNAALQCKGWDLNIWSSFWESLFSVFLPENSCTSWRLQLWLPHMFLWHLILLTATLMFKLTFIRIIIFIPAYPLLKVCLSLYTKVLYEVSAGFLFFFLILYSSLFLHKLINLCFSITSVFMCPSSLQWSYFNVGNDCPWVKKLLLLLKLPLMLVKLK